MAVDVMIHAALSRRIREVRHELYGESGGPALAEDLGLPPETWANFEGGVIIPAPVILGFIELTGIDPHWLFTGQGRRYARRPATADAGDFDGRPGTAAGS
jgi:hypothetical protein